MRVSDLQSDSGLGKIRNSCDVLLLLPAQSGYTDSLLTGIAGTKNYSVEKSLSDALVGSATAVSKVEPIEGGFREDLTLCCRSSVEEEEGGREGGEGASQVCSND